MEDEEGPFVLIGDDVNEDPAIYHELRNKFPEKVKEIYIHNVENKNFFSGQRSYWTAFDLGLMEHERGRISTKTLLRIGKEVLKSSPWKVLPPYGNCPPSGFLKKPFIQNEDILKLAKKIDLRIQEICKVR
ncbi:MAG: phosphatase domain-containing protein [Bdellovibrionota bacterium]|nr:phosphatase domain-containing protein [Bdellovibrionota bacterium]